MHKLNIAAGMVVLAWVGAGLLGCNASLFNPSFVNQQTGDVYPLAPGARSSFILIRANNTTSRAIEFVITAERQAPDPNNPDATVTELETRRVFTRPVSGANDVGVLMDCPVARIGLGEVLDQPQTEPGLFVGAQAVGAGGFGVPPNVNPLDASVGNFECGDTIVFRAAQSASVAGGVTVGAFVLDADTQPVVIRGLDTFLNARTLIEEKGTDEEEG